MTWKRAILKVCSKLMVHHNQLPFGVLFPYAHIASDTPPVHVRHLYKIPSIAKFKSDIDFLLRHYRPLLLSELKEIPYLHDVQGPARYFVLSFDDGMREVYDIIAPILRSKGVPAVFFLNSATIDNKQLMWRHKVSLLIERCIQQPGRLPPQLGIYPGRRLRAKLKALRFSEEHILNRVARFLDLDFDAYLRGTKPYLTSNQVLNLARDGFEFGAHSESHPNFNEMTIEDQKKQISMSVHFIRALGLPCRYFAFPFSDHGVSTSVFRYMTELDLLLSFGTSEARRDSITFSFQRFALDGENVNLTLQDLLMELSAKSFLRRASGTEVIRRG